jgi:hypothetical protein
MVLTTIGQNGFWLIRSRILSAVIPIRMKDTICHERSASADGIAAFKINKQNRVDLSFPFKIARGYNVKVLAELLNAKPAKSNRS